MDSAGAQFVGASCGQHGPYTFYKAFKYFKDKKPKILSLGEFFFVEILRDAPVSIGELQLLWQDKNSNQLLTSVRLYFLPEHTPDGKLDYHGEDEILALSEKLILRLDDLVSLITEDVTWQQGLSAVCDSNGYTDDTHNEELVQAFKGNNCGLQLNDVIKEKKLIGDIDPPDHVLQVVIMSYSQYCRYRTILKRLETVTDKWLKNAIVNAIGGFTVKSRNCKIMFCREMFYHPELEDFELRMDHLAPNLKGRPRKKKTLKRECSQDSDSYEDGSDTSSLASVSQTSSSTSSSRPRRRSSQNGFSWEKGNGKVSKEEQMFMINLRKFMKERQTPIDRVPSLGFKQIDLYYFYTLAKKLGGYQVITEKKLWKQLYDKLGGHPGSTSAATCTRRHYEKLLLAFERFERGSDQKNKVKSKVKAMITGHKSQEKLKLKSDLEEKKDLLMQALDVSVEEKVRKWNEIRKQKAIERDQMKKGPVRQTVKKMLDNVSSKENKSQESRIELPKELKVQIPKIASIDNKVKIEPKPTQVSSSILQHQKTKLEVPSVKQRTRPSILSPLVQRRVQNHVKSQSPLHQTSMSQHATVHHQPLQSPVISTHALYYASNFPLPASHFIAHPSSSSSSSVKATSHASEKKHPHFPKSSLFVTNNASQINESQSKQVIPSLRPSVIQHTPKVDDAVKYLGSSKSRSESPSNYSSKPVSQVHSNSVPAHSNHLKRAYPYSNSLSQKSPHVLTSLPPKARDSPKAHLNPVLANDPFFSNVKRVRTDPPSSHRATIHSAITNPVDSDQDQPVDFSMKTLQAKDLKTELKNEVPSVNDSAPKTFKCALFPQEFPTSAARANLNKEVERPGSRLASRSSPLPLIRSQEHGSVSPASTGSRSATSTPLNNNKLSSKPLAASAPYCEVVSPNLHPAFPAPYMPSQISPNNVVTSPVHLQQIYAAQYANIQMAAYEDMMRQQVMAQVGNPSPILLSPTQLFPNVYKDSQKFSASKS